jgi:hypothetical protein
MLQFKLFFEARKNPDVNKRELPMKTLEPYLDEPNYFISMRTAVTDKTGKSADINVRSKHHEPTHKIGINPKSVYDTPNGIYTYRLVDVAYQLDNEGLDGLPFMGQAPFIYLVENIALDRTLNLKDITEDEVKAIIDRTIEKNPNIKMSFMNNISTGNIKSMEGVIGTLGQLINKTKIELFVDNYEDEYKDDVESFIAEYFMQEIKPILKYSEGHYVYDTFQLLFDNAWNETFGKSLKHYKRSDKQVAIENTKNFFKLFIDYLKKELSKSSKSEEIDTEFIYTKGTKEAIRKKYPGGIFFWFTYILAGGKGSTSPNPNKWNKQIRDLGYDVLIDPGLAIIHPNEPTQTVFLTKQAFKVVKVIGNYMPSGKTKEKK